MQQQAAALRPHTVVATLMDADVGKVSAALKALPKDVDLAEIRLDALWPVVPDTDQATDQLLALLDAAKVPLLATLRPKRQGGRFDGPETVRIGLLQAALRAGFAHADVELDVLQTKGLASTLAADGGLIGSQHAWGEMPCRSDGLQVLQAMQDLRVGYDKYALEAGAFPDLLRALEFTRAHAERGGKPAVSTMTHGGAPLRALLALVGNRATYGAAPGLAPAVPGQPMVEEVLALWHHWGLDHADLDHLAAKPRPWLAVFGMPALHSLSPRIHNAALKAARRDERYGVLEVPASASALRLALHVAPRIGMAGASVTAPHKTDAARIAQGDATVKATGAANCLKFAGDKALATNTDASAFARLAKTSLARGDRALVLGSGGAARAAIHALAAAGASVTVASRDQGRGVAAAALGAHWVPWEQRADPLARFVVQATPVGSGPGDPSPLPSHVLAKKPFVVELVYAAGPTKLQTEAAKAGCAVVDGQSFLVEQAADAYRFWFGQEPKREAMSAAVRA